MKQQIPLETKAPVEGQSRTGPISVLCQLPEALIAELRRTGPTPVLAAEKRTTALAWLRCALVDFRSLDRHIRLLQRLYDSPFRYPRPRRDGPDDEPPAAAAAGRFPFAQPLPEPRVLAVVDEGIDVLDNDELASLMLNPIALFDLFDVIGELCPDAWLAVMQQVGQEMLAREEGESVPPRPTGDMEEEERVRAVRAACDDPALWERLVAQAFQLRGEAERAGIDAFFRQPEPQRRDTIARLRRSVEAMRRPGGAEQFRQQDVDFHLLLSGGHSNLGDVRKACEFFIRHPGRPRLRPNREAGLGDYEAVVVAEHEAIVAALERGDLEGSVRAAVAHLNKSLGRLYPKLLEQIRDANSAFFRKMRQGSVLWFASLNVTPIEMHDQYWDSMGRAAAHAVAAGATLFYLQPSESLLRRWQSNGIAMDVEPEDFHGVFDTFRDKVVREVAGRTPADEVRDRLRAVFLDNDALFHLVRPNHSLGYYHHPDGSDLLTVREPLSDDDAWPRILPRSPTRLEREHVLAVLREALEGLPDEAERSALVRWLPRPTAPR